jgi:hypothetical protein
MGEKGTAYRLARGKETALDDKDVGWWIILGRILEKWNGVMWTGLVWLRFGTGEEVL